MNTPENMIKMAFSAMAGMGDIFTDARECAGSVAAAQNLAVLAGKLSSKLSGQDSVVAGGHLLADGKTVCPVTVSINGSLSVQLPDDFDTSGKIWKLALATGRQIPVAMFAGECSDDESWVIDDAEAFYDEILKL